MTAVRKKDAAVRKRNAPGLPDYLPAKPRVLFVGINPGMRSAALGHHFAGYSNRFWRLLFESGLTPILLKADDDVRLLEWGYGITNVVPRPTPGIDTLRPEEYRSGVRALRRKVRAAEPTIVALVGLTLFRVVFRTAASTKVTAGLQEATLDGARVFVLPNPSGRNAHFSYASMLDVYRALAVLAQGTGADRW